MGTDSLGSLRDYSFQQLFKSAEYGYNVIERLLELKYAKLVATPLLDLTEKSVNYFIPTYMNGEYNQNFDGIYDDDEKIKKNGKIGENKNFKRAQYIGQETTMKRIYDINNRVLTHVFQKSVQQIENLNAQYDNLLRKLNQLKKFSDQFYEKSKTTVTTTIETNKISLRSLCSKYVDVDKISKTVN